MPGKGGIDRKDDVGEHFFYLGKNPNAKFHILYDLFCILWKTSIFTSWNEKMAVVWPAYFVDVALKIFIRLIVLYDL